MPQLSVVRDGKDPLPRKEARKVLGTWLHEYPGALVGAVRPDGMPSALPEDLPLPGFVLEARSVLDLVQPADSSAVTEGFLAALDRGFSITRVRLASEPAQLVLLHYLDLRDEFGIVLRLLAPTDASGQSGAPYVGLSAEDLVPNRPRLGFMTKDAVATITSVDEATTRMLGWPAAEMVGRRSLDFIHPDDHVRAIDSWMARRSNPTVRGGTVRLRHLRQDGSWLWLEVSNEFIEQNGEVTVATQLLDISSEMAASEALRRSEELLRRVTETVPVGLFHVSCDREVLFVNPVAQRLLGDVLPRSQAELCTLLAPGREAELDSAIDRVVHEGVEAYLDLEFTPASTGIRSSCQVSLRSVSHQEGTAGALGCIVDVTELKQIADTDPLTGLGNRRAIMQMLEQELRKRNGRVAAFFVDLDRFKPINDRFGHAAGDRTLVAVAERLRASVRPDDHIGRLGGDEFVVICPGIRREKEALDLASRIKTSFGDPLDLDGNRLVLTASIGVSLASKYVTADDLVAAADAAMYQAKQSRGGPPVLVTPTVTETAQGVTGQAVKSGGSDKRVQSRHAG
jgi:diguanylate cyclase (GGDEF)-like protein/PAS domain S-box-containing protein